MIAKALASPQPHRALVVLLVGQGRKEAALREGLAAAGQDGELLFLNAGFLEARRDFEGAVAVYRAL